MDSTVLIHNLFEKQCQRLPHKTALVCDSGRISYAELDLRANRIAECLIQSGVPRETPIAIICEKNIDYVASVLGILKAGCAFVPIDRNYPLTRVEYLVKQVNIEYMITNSSNTVLFGERVGNVKIITPSMLMKSLKPAIKLPKVQSDNLAYIIYTSGSTGAPKGTMIEHKSIVHTLLNQIDFINLQPEDNYLCFSSIAFDSSICEIFGTLAAGATAFLYDRTKNFSPKALLKYINKHEITAATFTPSVLKLLRPEALPTLQKVISAGEKCSLDLMRQWAKHKNFYNGYGPTEASVCTHMKVCHYEDFHVTLGDPLGDNCHYVLNDAMQPVVLGEIGQLYLSGPCVARGYANLSGDCFLKNPFSKDPTSRIYRTGDLVRLYKGSQMEYIGRKDQQIKINGCRVDPFEIAEVLKYHKAIKDAIVTVVDNDGRNKIIAYYKVKKCYEVTSEQVRKVFVNYFPDYMIPAFFIETTEFPLNYNLKIDFHQLIGDFSSLAKAKTELNKYKETYS